MQAGKYKGYPIYISDRLNKKYYAVLNNGSKIHFGDSRYQHYFDKIGYYSHLNHYDLNRRNLYKKRHDNNRHIKYTPGWFSDNILW